ncbi:hypothetical protein T440DRAFT_470532 [Plenodomus tracheiphilus IPT5]|uniref:Pentacotripeptide-repeat region of PRORP domain-containing protein n=1 Tax=Plenodomus tracheiphilus IPT5 TaxID=1408161 RepID=A0A6A7AXG7_9PLEO|nr:hypothetical protein T440DRAFT_470532 [Plenodomus tracheiphilus IPT5]
MPRVRLPHASIFAGAEFPILPFLAPRVFTESPAPRRGPQHAGSNGIYTKEEKEAETPGIRSQQAERTTAARSRNRSRLNSPRASSGPCRVRRLYADIFSITRQQARSYASIATSVTDSSEPHSIQRPLDDDLKADSMSSERSKAVAIETERLQSYLSRYAHLSEEKLMQRGHYRSLCRRIANLSQWHLQDIDLSSDLGPENSDWLIQAFAALDRSVYAQVANFTREIRIIHRPECALWCSMLLEGIDQDDDTRMWKNWTKHELQVRELAWRPLLVYLLDCKPSRALDFMQILVEDSRLRGDLDPSVLADALGYLSRLHLNGRYDTDPDWNIDPVRNGLEFAPAFYNVYTRILTKRTHTLSQDLIYNISQFAEIEDFKKIFDLLIEEKTRFGFDTLLHYANVFAEAGEVDYALRCMNKLSEAWRNDGAWDKVVDRQRLRWTCALILRKTASQESGYRATPGLIENFIGMGVKMDLTLYNVVMHNAMEAGDYATAFKLYNSLEEHDLKPDTHTLGILLHGCTLQDNPLMFSAFARHCRDTARETQNSWLASEYLYHLYVRHQDTVNAEEFATGLWRAYLKIFTATALEPFVSLRRRYLRARIAAPALEPGITLMEPPPMALYIMLQVEIQYAMSLGGQPVQTLYDQFKVLVLTNKHPGLTELAKQPIIWNAFLLAFCRKELFASASQVVRDMSENSPQPNVYSWNIFMQAFFKTGQVQAAERVFEIMRSRGIDPDQYTHGVLLRGYAKAQLVDRIGETMQQLDAEHEMDPGLIQALSRVVDRENMMRVLEESRIAKEARIQQQAEKEAEERSQRWTMPEYIDPEDEVVERRGQDGVLRTAVEKEMSKMEEQVQKLGDQFFKPPAPKRMKKLRIRKIGKVEPSKPRVGEDGEEYF